MALFPPAKCLLGNVNVPLAAAQRRGATTTPIPVAIWLQDTPIGDQWFICIQIAGTWRDISVPSTVPNISDGKVYWDGERSGIIAEINQIGMKGWILREIQEWASKLLYAEFKDDIAVANPTAPQISLSVDNFVDQVNAALPAFFVLLDTNGDGVPEFHGK